MGTNLLNAYPWQEKDVDKEIEQVNLHSLSTSIRETGE